MENTTEVANMIQSMMERTIKAEVELAKAEMKAEMDRENLRKDYGEFYEALARAQAKFENPKKTKLAKGKSYDWKYSSLADILSVSEPHLNAEGIFFSQHTRFNSSGLGTTVVVITELMFKNGLKIAHESHPLSYNLNMHQEARSKISYLRRCAATDILGLEGEEDDDGQFAALEAAQANKSNYSSGQTRNFENKSQKTQNVATEKPSVSTTPSVKKEERSAEEILKSGIERAKNVTTDEGKAQLDQLIGQWEAMPIKDAIKAVSAYVRQQLDIVAN